MPITLAAKRLLFQWAPTLALAVAKFMSRARRLELETVQAVVPRGRLAIDVGASWGLYTFLLQRCTNVVVAFEPNPEKAEYLSRIFKKGVTIYPIALSDRSGKSELIVPLAASALATIEAANPLSAATDADIIRIKVPLSRLSEFELQNVGFIKVDVEGHELSVLSGAHDLLTRDNPILFIEIERRHNPDNFTRVFDLLFGLGYKAFVCDGRRVADFRFFNLDRDQPPANVEGGRIKGHYLFNFLFLPSMAIATASAGLRKAGFNLIL